MTALLILRRSPSQKLTAFYERGAVQTRAKSGRASAGARPDTHALSVLLLSSQVLLGENAERLRVQRSQRCTWHFLKNLASVFFFNIDVLSHLRVWNTGRLTAESSQGSPWSVRGLQGFH